MINQKKKDSKIELYNDHFQNFKRYNIPKAQLIIADKARYGWKMPKGEQLSFLGGI